MAAVNLFLPIQNIYLIIQLYRNDLIVHQLEGYPEIIPLRNLPQINRPFQVMRFKSP